VGFFERVFGGGKTERVATPPVAAPRTYDLSDPDGNARRYSSDDFDEVYTTLDEPEMRRLVGIGWLLLDEQVGPGGGAGRVEFEQRAVPTSWGAGFSGGMSTRTVPVERDPDDVTTYVLGHLKTGRAGQPI